MFLFHACMVTLATPKLKGLADQNKQMFAVRNLGTPDNPFTHISFYFFSNPTFQPLFYLYLYNRDTSLSISDGHHSKGR